MIKRVWFSSRSLGTYFLRCLDWGLSIADDNKGTIEHMTAYSFGRLRFLDRFDFRTLVYICSKPVSPELDDELHEKYIFIYICWRIEFVVGDVERCFALIKWVMRGERIATKICRNRNQYARRLGFPLTFSYILAQFDT